MTFKTKEEFFDYIYGLDLSEKTSPFSSVYFLVKCDGEEKMLSLFPYRGTYLEIPCELRKYRLSKDDLIKKVQDEYDKKDWMLALEYEKRLQDRSMHYEIVALRHEPCLTEDIELLGIYNEIEAVEWFRRKELKKK